MKAPLRTVIATAAFGAVFAVPLTATAGGCGSGMGYMKPHYQGPHPAYWQAMGKQRGHYGKRYYYGHPQQASAYGKATSYPTGYDQKGYGGYQPQASGYGQATNYRTGYKQKDHGGEQEQSAAPTANLVDTAVSAGSFTTLVTAVQVAGLEDTLKGEGPFTVFAPTDEAFAKIPQDQLEALLADKDALTQVLTYHVVPGAVTSSEVVKLDSAQTVQGSSVSIDATDGVKIDGAKVVKADIRASNGIIHVIDTVIMPN